MYDSNEIQAEFKSFSMEESGTFEGLLSAYGNVDSDNEVFERGAYTKTLKEKGGKLVLCYQHDHKQPIGFMDVKETEEGLEVKGYLNLDEANPTARRAYSDIKFLRDGGMRMGLSVGFMRIPGKSYLKNGITYIKEVKLVEGSVVTVPANDQTWIESVKSGRAISRARREVIEAALAASKVTNETLQALLSEADAGTSIEPEAAKSAAAEAAAIPAKPDLSKIHSAIKLITNFKWEN